jgi:hypothetical protein
MNFKNPYAGFINLYAVISNPCGPRSSSNTSVSMKEFGGDLVPENKLIDTNIGVQVLSCTEMQYSDLCVNKNPGREDNG